MADSNKLLTSYYIKYSTRFFILYEKSIKGVTQKFMSPCLFDFLLALVISHEFQLKVLPL